FLALRAGDHLPLVEVAYRWAQIGDSRFEVAFYFDRLAAVMALVVTGVGSMIHVYSVGYMKDDPGYGRFFAYLNLFLFFMLLLFVGATGKSAQIPLHVWLPDAMAGPTPVSALIHAATMVTAGVYLVARMSGVYLHAPEASALIAAIGVTTAFFAATVALVQTD